MFKKVLKSLLILTLPLVFLTSCGKKISTEEIFENSIVNFANASDYSMNTSMGLKLTVNDSDFLSLNSKTAYNVNNTSNVVLKNDETSMFFLFFGDTKTETSYEDFNNSIKYLKEGDSEDIFKESISAKQNPTYVLNTFLRNGVLLSGEHTEYSMNDVDYYVLPLSMNFQTITSFISSIDKEALLEEFDLDGMSLDTSTISQEQKEEFMSLTLNFNYLVYKDSLLPALIEIDSNSITEFSTKLNNILNSMKEESPEMSENISFSMDIDLSELQFNFSLENISISLGGYGSEQKVEIPSDVIANAKEYPTYTPAEVKADFHIEEDYDEEELDEDYDNYNYNYEENYDNEEDTSSQFEYKKDFIEFNFVFEDLERVYLLMKVYDLKNFGFNVLIPEEDTLEPNTYSIPIEVTTEKGDTFYITVMNDSEETLNIEDCKIIRAEFDALDIVSDFYVYGKDIGFDADIKDLYFMFNDESFVYEGETSTVYTYQYGETKYMDFQIDNETGKICYISLTNMSN